MFSSKLHMNHPQKDLETNLHSFKSHLVGLEPLGLDEI